MREVVSSACELERYEPSADSRGVATYERFLAVTGLNLSSQEPTLA